jgi:hypothetical protein
MEHEMDETDFNHQHNHVVQNSVIMEEVSQEDKEVDQESNMSGVRHS